MIGTGGYASLPILIVGSIFKTKIVIQEQNYLPGISNKILSRFASLIAVAYENVVVKDENSIMKAQMITFDILTKDIIINSDKKIKLITN